MDEDGNKQLSYEEFLTGLREAGMEITDDEAKEMFQEFDTDNSGGVNLEEFFVAIRVRSPLWSLHIHVQNTINTFFIRVQILVLKPHPKRSNTRIALIIEAFDCSLTKILEAYISNC